MAAQRWRWITLVSEPDDGLFDAMNKGLLLADGRYVLFLNAGDSLDESFSLESLQRSVGQGDPVLFGYSVECWKGDKYLRPGPGKEGRVLSAPPHQATFYPRRFYKSHSYDLSLPIGADGAYTSEAVRACGATFVPFVVCRFELGGRSTSYGNAQVFRIRLREANNLGQRVKLVTKTLLWWVLPQGQFYRLLARGKYARVTDLAKERLIQEPLIVVAVPVTR